MLGDAFPDRLQASDLFAAMRETGLLGRKAGEGIYRYGSQGKPRLSRQAQRLLERRCRAAAPLPQDGDLLDRLLLPLVSEAFLCREESLVAEDGDLDLAMIMGIGWPAHTGGPLRWARARGLDTIVARMEELAARHGSAGRPGGRSRMCPARRARGNTEPDGRCYAPRLGAKSPRLGNDPGCHGVMMAGWPRSLASTCCSRTATSCGRWRPGW